jgi:predicted ferric reductase
MWRLGRCATGGAVHDPTTPWRVSYDVWHALHAVLAVIAVVAALARTYLVGFYLNSPWKKALWLVITLAFVSVLVWVRIVKPIVALQRPWTVRGIRAERGDTTTLTLRPRGHAGFRFAPGQYARITVGKPPFSITSHPFSFSSSGENAGQVEMTQVVSVSHRS